QLGEGGVAGSEIEGPAGRDGTEARMEGGYADPEGSGRGGGPGPGFRLAHGARYAGPVGGSSVTLGFGKGSPGARQKSYVWRCRLVRSVTTTRVKPLANRPKPGHIRRTLGVTSEEGG